MSHRTCTNSFLDIPRFTAYLETYTFSKYFTCIYDRNVLFLIGEALSYVIGLLLVLLKKLTSVIQVTRSPTNSKFPSSHTLYTF